VYVCCLLSTAWNCGPVGPATCRPTALRHYRPATTTTRCRPSHNRSLCKAGPGRPEGGDGELASRPPRLCPLSLASTPHFFSPPGFPHSCCSNKLWRRLSKSSWRTPFASPRWRIRSEGTRRSRVRSTLRWRAPSKTPRCLIKWVPLRVPVEWGRPPGCKECGDQGTHAHPTRRHPTCSPLPPHPLLPVRPPWQSVLLDKAKGSGLLKEFVEWLDVKEDVAEAAAGGSCPALLCRG
jgi:hypothetical protein